MGNTGIHSIFSAGNASDCNYQSDYVGEEKMSTVIYIVLATLVGIGVAAIFVGVEEFPEIDSCGYDETDEHEDLTR